MFRLIHSSKQSKTRSRLKGALTQLRGCFRDDSGQSQVEFAITCTLLLPLLFGMTAFGFAMNNYLSLTEANGVGARQFAVERGQGGDPCAISSNSIAAAAPMLSNTGSSATGIGYSFTVNGIAYGATCPSAILLQGASVTITNTYPCNLKFYGKNYGPTSCFLTASTAEVLQ